MKILRFLTAFLTAAFVSIPAAFAAVTPLTGQFPVDDAPDCQEREADVAFLRGGGYVVTWVGQIAGQPSFGRVYARIFDAGNQPLGPELVVGSAPSTGQDAPAVATDSDGRILIVWHDGPRDEVVGRLFHPSGAAVSQEFRIASPAGGGHDVIAVPGGFVVAWADYALVQLRAFDRDGVPTSPTIDAEARFGILGPSSNFSPSLARFASGDIALVWTFHNQSFISAPVFSSVDGRVIPAGALTSSSLWKRFSIDSVEGIISGTVAGTSRDSLVVAWREQAPQGFPLGIFGQTRNAAGTAVYPARQLDEGGWGLLSDPDLLVDPDGGFIAAWSGGQSIMDPVPIPSIYVGTFSPDGTRQGSPEILDRTTLLGSERPALAFLDNGEAIVVWQEGQIPPASAPARCYSEGISARRFSPGCLPSAGQLCLGDGRFRLEATWSSLPTGSGPGRAVPITEDTGYFWFFDEKNIELMVKVLDGRAVNGKFWVFYGSLSNVAYRLRVTDTVTGAVKNYDNPAGQLASRGDTDALPGTASSVSSGADSFELRPLQAIPIDPAGFVAQPEAEVSPSGFTAFPSPAEAAGPCTITSGAIRPGLCLNGRRFEIEVTWDDPFNGTSGVGDGVRLTDDSGYFWFFDRDNVELVVKALDARIVNGKFWIFYGALTNVEYTLRVRHFSGAQKEYHNPPFQFLSRADTSAFTPPPPSSCACPAVVAPVCGWDGRTYNNDCEALCQGFVQVAHTGPCT